MITQKASQLLSGINVKLLGTDTPTPGPPGLQTEIAATTLVYTVFTKPGETQLLYSSTGWVKIRLRLEDAGPVSIGTKQSLTPVLSGAGMLLPTGIEVDLVLPKGNRLYIAADAINRVGTIIEPIPWGEILAMRLTDVVKAVWGKK